ncbi:MAG: mechanosensitive ion channel [Halanaerobiales bacterium]|nr:mechanosensitive ion channel [Halanaerobiales bacterium]
MEYLTQIKDLAIQYGIKLLIALIIVYIGLKIIKYLVKLFEKSFKNKIEKTLMHFLKSVIKVLLNVLLILTAASTLGIEMTSFIAVLGAMSFAVGLSLQGSLANFAGGVLILLFKPYVSGDLIEAGGNKGTVIEIQILYTVLKTPDNKKVMIPNGKLSNSDITNYSANDSRRVDLVFGIGYDDDLLKAKEILKEIIDSNEMVLKEPAPLIKVGGLADSSVNFDVKIWCKTPNYWDLYYDMLEKVKLRFDEEGIGIPYPQIDIHLDK